MRGRALVFAIACAACGDELVVEAQFEATSGTRLALTRYLFEDGTQQTDPTSFYDTELHTQCTPRVWADGVLRCVPVANDALYTNAECTSAVGVVSMSTVLEPTHFIANDYLNGSLVPSHLFRTGARIGTISQYYLRYEGECMGPYAASPDPVYFALAGELDSGAMLPIVDDELGAGRLGLQVRRSEDGMQVAKGVHDRALDVPCVPTLRSDGEACEPTESSSTAAYLDDQCSEPAVVVPNGLAPPTMVHLSDLMGCTTYRPLGMELTASLFRRDGERCVRIAGQVGQRSFGLGDAVELAMLERDVDASGERRLQSVRLADRSDPALRFTANQLVDRSIRAECQLARVGEHLRCLPVKTAPLSTLYRAGCASAVQVAILAERTCGPVAFARGFGEDGLTPEIRAIGERATAVYAFSADGCEPYVAPPGIEIYEVGPPLPEQTFISALAFGERSP